jgi:hypothetical protein
MLSICAGMKTPFGLRRRLTQLLNKRANDRINNGRGVRPGLLMHCVSNMASDIGKKFSPGGGFVDSGAAPLPTFSVQCRPFSAIQALSIWVEFSSRWAAGGVTSTRIIFKGKCCLFAVAPA